MKKYRIAYRKSEGYYGRVMFVDEVDWESVFNMAYWYYHVKVTDAMTHHVLFDSWYDSEE